MKSSVTRKREIVRCGDCKHLVEGHTRKNKDCEYKCKLKDIARKPDSRVVCKPFAKKVEDEDRVN